MKGLAGEFLQEKHTNISCMKSRKQLKMWLFKQSYLL